MRISQCLFSGCMIEMVSEFALALSFDLWARFPFNVSHTQQKLQRSSVFAIIISFICIMHKHYIKHISNL